MKALSQVCSLLVSCLQISLSLLAGKQKLMTESLVKTRQHFFLFSGNVWNTVVPAFCILYFVFILFCILWLVTRICFDPSNVTL